HPSLRPIITGPSFPLLCLGLCMLSVYGQEWLKQPVIVARFINSRIVPNLHSVTLRDVFDSEAKRPGWDERPLDWWWFVEVKLVNDSESQVTVEDLVTRVRVGKQGVNATMCDDMGHFKMDMGLDADIKDKKWTGPRYRPLTSLIDEIRKVPLVKG